MIYRYSSYCTVSVLILFIYLYETIIHIKKLHVNICLLIVNRVPGIGDFSASDANSRSRRQADYGATH